MPYSLKETATTKRLLVDQQSKMYTSFELCVHDSHSLLNALVIRSFQPIVRSLTSE